MRREGDREGIGEEGIGYSEVKRDIEGNGAKGQRRHEEKWKLYYIRHYSLIQTSLSKREIYDIYIYIFEYKQQLLMQSIVHTHTPAVALP